MCIGAKQGPRRFLACRAATSQRKGLSSQAKDHSHCQEGQKQKSWREFAARYLQTPPPSHAGTRAPLPVASSLRTVQTNEKPTCVELVVREGSS